MSSSQPPEFLKIQYQTMQSTFHEILLRNGFAEEKARTCASVFADNSLDGVYTHGVNRFPRFIKYVVEGHVRPDAEPVRESAIGCIEQWDGRLGLALSMPCIAQTERWKSPAYRVWVV
jgi:3-dehydro-L-gulonate 2-dehydrogenase